MPGLFFDRLVVPQPIQNHLLVRIVRLAATVAAVAEAAAVAAAAAGVVAVWQW